MPNEKPKKKNMLGTFIIAAIAYIVLGVFMVAYPDKAAGGFRVVIGIILMVYGIINVISFFLNKDSEENLFMELALGVLAIGLGIFALVAPDTVEMVIFYAIGAVLIVDGVVNLKRAFNLKSMGFHRWNVFLIAAIIGVILGILCITLYNAFETAVIILIGISLIYEGVTSLVTICIDARTRKKISTELMRVDRDERDSYR